MKTSITPTPYRGDQSYIFMSYSHRNMDAAMKIVERMQADGYRVWYDEGIDPGTEWDENIASHVESCGFFIALLSSEYLDSSNCRDELNYARDLGKPRLLIYLEDVQLPGGMQMRLSRLQAVHQYRYKNPDRFYEKLYASKGMEICFEKRTEKDNIVNDSIADDNKEQQLLSNENKTTISNHPETADETLNIKENSPETVKEIQKTEKDDVHPLVPPVPNPVTTTEEEKKTRSVNKKVLILILAGAAALAAAVVGIVIGVTAGNSGGDPESAETSQVSEIAVQKTVPDLVGVSKEDAEKTLKRAGLTMKITEEKFSEKIEKGKVMNQDQEKGTKVDEGSEIGVVVSKGPEMVTVPSVVGEKKEDAKKKLEKIGFVCKFKESYNDSVKKGNVIEQSLMEKKSVKKGSAITLTISKGTEPVPSSQEEPVYQEPAYQEPVYQESVYQEPAYQEPAQETPTQETPTQETQAQETPTQETQAQETPAQETQEQATNEDAYDDVMTGDF